VATHRYSDCSDSRQTTDSQTERNCWQAKSARFGLGHRHSERPDSPIRKKVEGQCRSHFVEDDCTSADDHRAGDDAHDTESQTDYKQYGIQGVDMFLHRE
jgi:hypothetical protein